MPNQSTVTIRLEDCGQILLAVGSLIAPSNACCDMDMTLSGDAQIGLARLFQILGGAVLKAGMDRNLGGATRVTTPAATPEASGKQEEVDASNFGLVEYTSQLPGKE